MSKLDELIKEYCPNGIEYKKVGTICTVLRGKRLTTKELLDDGAYPVIHGGTTPMGYYDKANRKAGGEPNALRKIVHKGFYWLYLH